ncbi:hypothetical protein AX16_009826 [Volvariella volvacea WC 439]|nr:hypothetical protein AX16_009826 [Volvariella volvacea WC 439]
MLTFGYRPIEVLRADGIAPVCRSNKRASDANEIIEISDDDDDDQDNEEVHRKLSELKAQTEELQKSIKRPRKRIKVEDGRLANNQGREH